MRPTRFLAASILILLAGATTLPARGQAAPTYALYRLAPPDLTAESAATFARSQKLKLLGGRNSGQVPVQVFTDSKKTPRMLFRPGDGSLTLLPAVQRSGEKALSPRATLKQATDFLRKNKLIPPDAQNIRAGEVITLSAQDASPRRRSQPQRDVLRTAHFFRQLDGLRVFGPQSQILVNVSNLGVVGARRSILPLTGERAAVDIISPEVATRLFHGQWDQHFLALYGQNRSTYDIVSTDLVYYEQGQQFIQPAYRFEVDVTGPDGDRSRYSWFVPAAQQSPEAIQNLPPAAEGTDPVFADTPQGRGVAPAASSVDYGMYVVRDDADGWVNDAWGFHTNVDTGNFIYRFLHGSGATTNKRQYYWDYPWMWEADGSIPDNSPSFVGSVNVGLIEGHGAPWLITTEKNCCDVIHLPQITGYGAFNGSAGKTRYVIWQSCDVVPAPGDAYGGDFQSPSTAFDVWFKIFKGMRGTYGYHTTMHIYNGVGSLFGLYSGLGVSNLSAWFAACDGSVFGHSNDWDYGSAVLISGHEGDTIYDTAPLPKPGSLTIWWQHP